MLYEPWHIQMFGGFSAVRGAERITRFRTRKVGALFAWLAYHRRRTLSREEAAGVIWPESDTTAGRASLRVALSSLRTQLEPHGVPANSVVVADRAHLSLNPSSTITDVCLFEKALDESVQSKDTLVKLNADCRAVEYYTGDLLSGWYEDWIFTERERLRNAYEAAINRIVSELKRRGQEADALPYYRRLTELDVANETGQIGLMRADLFAGRPNAALRRYSGLNTALAEISALPCSEAGALANSASTMWHASAQTSHAQLVEVLPYGETTFVPPFEPLVVATTLPLTLDRFFGRSGEATQICRMLNPSSQGNSRLVTLTGAGGAGKTRLAIEAAAALADAFANRVVFVPLAEVDNAPSIVRTIATAMRINTAGAENTIEQVLSIISKLPYLFVLDNLEQMLSGSQTTEAAEQISELLVRNPLIRILTTSRQRLGVAGEREIVVAPLPLPVEGADLEQLAASASVQLFVDRAAAVRADFRLRSVNCAAVGEVCRRLEGIPLAIELAAAWSHVLSPQQMLDRIARRFELLVTRRKRSPARHSTMRDAIEWGTKLLTKAQRVFLWKLAIFSPEFSLEAVQEVFGAADALNMVTELVERSLVIADETVGPEGPEIRYRLLEMVRSVGLENLDPLERLQLRRQHAGWYARWSVRASDYCQQGHDQLKGLLIVDLDIDNIRSAVMHCRQDSYSCLDGIQLMGCLHYYWQVRGNYTETRSIMDDLLTSPEAVQRTLQCSVGFALAGTMAIYQNDLEAAGDYYDRWLTTARAKGDSREIASALQSLGSVAALRGEYQKARKYYEQCIEAFEAADSLLGVASAHGAFGELAMQIGEYEEALVWTMEAVKLQRVAGHRGGIAHHLKLLAEVHALLNDSTGMRACAKESLSGYFELADWRGMAALLIFLATNCPMSDAVAQLIGHAATLHKRTSAAPLSIDALNQLGVCDLGSERYESALARGANMGTLEAYQLALRTLNAPS